MGEPALERASYADVLAAPEHMVAEVIDGELHLQPRPAMPHARAASRISGVLGEPFDRGRGGPGGWIILYQPELHLGREPDILVPELAGWRRERLPSVPDSAFVTIAPDWVCEIVSPSTARRDRGPGVLNGLLGNFGVSGDRSGNLFEHLFVSQLWASAAAFDRDLRLGTLRTRGGLEVDFVVTLGGDTWLIEVKSTSSPQGGDVRPLKRAALRLPSSIRCILAHAGSTERVIDGVPALPWQKALAEMGL